MSKERQIGEGVVLVTESAKGPPAVYKYSIKPVGFYRVVFTFNFEGSVNFELVDTASVPGHPLQAVVSVNPFEISNVVTCRQADVHKGGSLSMSMSWVLEAPGPDVTSKYLADFSAKIETVLAEAQGIFPREVVERGFDDIVERCRQNHTSFVDVSFPPNNDSLFRTKDQRVDGDETSAGVKRNPIIWRRPSEFFPPVSGDARAYELFHGQIEPNDIKQGQLGDCWLMCSLASIAEFPALVKDLFLQSTANEFGVYQLRLCKNGNWVVVPLDDFFPCSPESGPIYSRANGKELWVLLVEKAFAKVHGSYAAIKSGWAFEAMMDLTGAPYKDLRFSDREVAAKIKDGSLWDYICECDRLKYILSCSTPGHDKSSESSGERSGSKVGLVPGHAYTLLTALTTSTGVRLAKVRNPWGSLEWNGAWSDSSDRWTPELKAEVGFESGDDGMFWICFEDLVTYFVGINICMCRHPELNANPWKESRHPFNYQFSRSGHGVVSVPLYILTIEGDNSDVYVSVHQKDKRCIGSLPYIDIGATLLQKTADGKYRYVASSGNSVERQNQLEIKSLAAGEYLVVPTSTGCKIQQQKDIIAASRQLQDDDFSRNAVLAIHSSEWISVREIAFDAEAFEEAMELPVIKDGTVMDLFGDGSVLLHTLKSGYAGLSYVASNTTDSDPIQLTLDFSGSTNILSHRGALSADVVVPPKEAKVMHHISPADDCLDWSCGWSCNARWLTEEEMYELNAAESGLRVDDVRVRVD